MSARGVTGLVFQDPVELVILTSSKMMDRHWLAFPLATPGAIEGKRLTRLRQAQIT